jgi:putative metalloprotease
MASFLPIIKNETVLDTKAVLLIILHMRKSLLIIFMMWSSFFITSCEDTNVRLAAEAANEALQAITLTDKEVTRLSRKTVQKADQQNLIAPPNSSYANRLSALTKNIPHLDGYSFNFKVYMTKDINAFALADGSIRLNSGLMDIMNDNELLFVIGHEIGHVVKNHSRKKVVLAYASSALRKGVASQANEAGLIASSILGRFVEQLTHAQFSQYEELEADLYGVSFLQRHGIEPEAARTALTKLAQLKNSHGILSTHPEPKKRIKRLSDAQHNSDQLSVLEKVYSLIRTAIVLVADLLKTIISWLISFF